MSEYKASIRIPDRETLLADFLSINTSEDLLVYFYPPLLARAEDELDLEELIHLFIHAFTTLTTEIAKGGNADQVIYISVHRFVFALMRNAPEHASAALVLICARLRSLVRQMC